MNRRQFLVLADIGSAIRYTESLGYKGLYSIEVNPQAAIGIVYNTIVANL